MTTMNQDQLRAIFHYLKVPASAYDLGNNTRLGACETIEHTLQGWEVYATERGSKLRYSPMKPMPVSICSIA